MKRHVLFLLSSRLFDPRIRLLQLLTRFYIALHAANPSLLSNASKKRYTIAPPQIFREGNKKSIFANVTDICRKMHRQVRCYFNKISCHAIYSFVKPEHVIAFLFAEMGTTGSVDGAGRLVIRGRFQQKQIENVLRRYMGMAHFLARIFCHSLSFTS